MFFGRTIEGKKLDDNFLQVIKGGSRQLLVSGPAGVGKTRLIQQFALAAEANQGCFVFAKSDLKSSRSPLAPVRGFLNMLVKRAIAEDPGKMDEIALEIGQEFGKHLDSLVSILPALTFLSKGPIAPNPEKNLEDTSSFLNTLLCRLIQLLARRFKGVAIFMDDIQWMDPGSYSFLNHLAKAGPLTGVMFIFGYRTLESTASPKLSETITAFKKRDSCQKLDLKGLPKRDIAAFLRNRLDTQQRLAPLSELCFEKTRGNPFYLIQMVEELLDQGLIHQSHGEWVWNLDAITALELYENVADLILARLRLIQAQTLRLLKYGACCHKEMKTETLKAVTGFPLEKIETLLWKPVKLDFLEKKPGGYAFTHDKILEAVENLITGDEKLEIHQKLLSCYLSQAPSRSDPPVFTLIFHYEFFCDRVEDPLLKKIMVNHYLTAGEKARQQTAYAQALEWFCRGKDHYPGDIWKKDYDLGLLLFNQCAESAYLSGKLQQSLGYCKIISRQTLRVEDSLVAGITQVYCLQALNQLGEAMAKGIDLLEKLGIKLPKNPSRFRIAASIFKTWAFLAVGLSSPLKKVDMNSRNRQIIKVMTALGAVFYNLSPKTYLPYMTAKAIRFSLKHGSTPETPSMFLTFGMILNRMTHSVKWGKKLSSAAKRIAAEWGSDALSGKEIMLANFFLDHWDLSMDEAAKAYEQGQKTCLETGDHEFYEYQAVLYADSIFFDGRPIDDVLADINRLKPSMTEYGDRIFSIRLKVLGALSQGQPRPWQLQTDYLEKTQLPDIETSIQQMFYPFCIAFINGDMDAAHELKHAGERIIENVAATPLYYQYYFMAALVEINVQTNPKEIAKCLKILKWSAKHNPGVYHYKYTIARGEKFRIQGSFSKALHLFESAARDLNKLPHALYEKALVNEKLGQIAADLGQKDRADEYFSKAAALYQNWGMRDKPGLFDARVRDQVPDNVVNTVSPENAGKSVVSPPPQTGDVMETNLLSMQDISRAESVRAVALDALQWKTWIETENGRVNTPAAFGDLPYKMLTFAATVGTVVRATADDSQEAFFDPAYFFNHHPSALMVIPGGEDKAVLLENPKENPEIDTLVKLADTIFREMENHSDQMGTGPSELSVCPDQLAALKACCIRLQTHMIQTRAYTNPNISLASLSRDLDIPERRISDAVNTCLGQNVQAFINSYRIEAVKSEILDPENHDKTIIDIAFEQGFNSKSAFNKAFKKFTELSPSAYKKKGFNKDFQGLKIL